MPLVLRAGAVALATATTLVGVTMTAAPASAHTASTNQQVKLAPRTHFTMKPDGSSGKTQGGEGIPNIDIVKSTVRTYYNATDGIADKTDSPYIDEMQQITHSPWRYLRKVAKAEKAKDARGHHKKPAIVFDADDTTLWTYDMEDAGMKFNFDPVLQDVYVQDQRFPATPGMVKFVNTAQKLGFAVFGLTGRNDAQKVATVANLKKVGYQPFDQGTFYTKWVSGATPTTDDPTRTWFAGTPCADGTCTTVEYKSLTGKHVVDDLKYDVVANLGDQYSDLIGGYADRAVKLPNPTYYLP